MHFDGGLFYRTPPDKASEFFAQVAPVGEEGKDRQKGDGGHDFLLDGLAPFDRVRGTFAGCDAYLVKPVDETRLLQVMAKFLPATVTSPALGAPMGRPAFR